MDKRFTDLQLLSATMEQMNEAENFVDVADMIFEFIKYYASYDMAVIYRVDKQAQQLEIVSCLGADINKLKRRVQFKVGEGAVGKVAQNKRPIHIQNALKEESILVRQFYDEDPIIRSFIAVPLIVRGEVIGILSVSSSKESIYSEYDVKMIGIIASQGALLLELNNQLSVTKTISDTVLENINSGVVLLNEHNQVLMFNSAAEKITGRDRREILGQPMTQLGVKLADCEDFAGIGVVTGAREQNEADGYLYAKNGERVELKVSTSFFQDKKDETERCICVFRDNTEIDRLQRQLMVAEKLAAVGKLTAGMTHEIRNPLLPISNASEYLYHKYRNVSEELDMLLKIIKDESDRLNKLLSQLSALYKNGMFVKGESHVATVMEEIQILLNYALAKKEIRLDTSGIDDGLLVGMSSDNLKQVTINVLLNAIDAITEECSMELRHISVRAYAKGTQGIIQVSDTGSGIKKEYLDKIFDPFFSTKDTGSGIGLSLVYRMVANAGGTVQVESVEGNGTVVRIVLPLVSGEGERNEQNEGIDCRR